MSFKLNEIIKKHKVIFILFVVGLLLGWYLGYISNNLILGVIIFVFAFYLGFYASEKVEGVDFKVANPLEVYNKIRKEFLEKEGIRLVPFKFVEWVSQPDDTIKSQEPYTLTFFTFGFNPNKNSYYPLRIKWSNVGGQIVSWVRTRKSHETRGLDYAGNIKNPNLKESEVIYKTKPKIVKVSDSIINDKKDDDEFQEEFVEE